MNVYKVNWKAYYHETSDHGEEYCVADNEEEAEIIVANFLSGEEDFDEESIPDDRHIWSGGFGEGWLYDLRGATFIGTVKMNDVDKGIVQESTALLLADVEPKNFDDMMRKYPELKYASITPEIKEMMLERISA